MKSLDTAELHRAMLALSKIESGIRMDKIKGGGETQVNGEISDAFKNRVASMTSMAHTLETPVTYAAVYRLKQRIEGRTSYWDVAENLADIQSRMGDELGVVTTFVLERKNKELLQEPEKLFGEEFATKFKSAGLREMTEAAKCRAYGLTTAAVFHLMRCMEIGVRTVAKCLGIPDPVAGSDRNWGSMLQ